MVSKRNARNIWKTELAPELLGKKENDLLKNPHFLGFFIGGKIPNDIKRILLKKYSDKILFDGKKIKKVSEELS